LTDKREDMLKRAQELLKGSRFEGDVARAREEAPATGKAGAADDLSQLLLRISEILNSILAFEAIGQRALELAIRYLNAERGVIFFLNERKRFEPIAQANVEARCVEDAMEYSASVLQSAAEDRALWSGDAMHDQRFSQFESIHAFNIRSFMCVPLKSRGKIVGTVYVDNRSLENTFDARSLDFLRMFANVAGVAIENASLHERKVAENRSLRNDIRARGGVRQIVGADPKLRQVLDIVERVADSTATVLVHGESGTGKEMIARAIHEGSPRLGQPFVALNCAAIPEQLLESELFGYAKGAFTGAQANKIGKFEAADGGTLFLDEIGDMSLPLQAKILRVLQEGTLEPLGSNQLKEVDVRIVAATNRDLAKMVQDGAFREDLYYRLNVIVLELPPLRERQGDIERLAEHFLKKCTTGKTPVREFSPEALGLMRAYSWPGNIRELENCVLRLSLLTTHEVVTAADVQPHLGGHPVMRQPGAETPRGGVRPLDETEREAILAALEHCGGNRTAAAHALGISVRTLQYKIKEYQALGIRVD
jgi:transcriptional regulator with GAF, ATPase, and Fis domain